MRRRNNGIYGSEEMYIYSRRLCIIHGIDGSSVRCVRIGAGQRMIGEDVVSFFTKRFVRMNQPIGDTTRIRVLG